MIDCDETEKERNGKRYSGFDVPTIGTIWPKGTTVKHNPDGTITLIPPEKTSDNTETDESQKKD